MVAFSQVARGPLLWGFGLVVMTMAVAIAGARVRRLLRRIRFLLLVLVVLFAFFTPGEALLPVLGRLSPTREGVLLAAVHALRLLAVVMLVAVLLSKTGERELVSGLMVLARPLAACGLPVERLAVRLLLVLRYVESAPTGGWRALLSERGDELPGAETFKVHLPALSLADRLAIAGLVAAIVWGASL